MDNPIKIGIIGGSGLYQMAGLEDQSEVTITTPFGDPSDTFLTGTLEGTRVVFLPRHGKGHRLIPSEVPYRANIYAFKTLGVERIISVSACGSLREDYAPGHIAIPDQLYDNTKGLRERSFFGNGIVAHVGVAKPFCADLGVQLSNAVEKAGGIVHPEGAFITIEGPRFSTKAESSVYRSWGMSLIGMTTSPEAFLAREAEICYATMAHITDYDVWHESEEGVSVERIIAVLKANLTLAQEAVRHIVKSLPTIPRTCECHKALADAIMTDRGAITPEARRRFGVLVEKYL
jgi:5'-methylthioadenosine phosphorylase